MVSFSLTQRSSCTRCGAGRELNLMVSHDVEDRSECSPFVVIICLLGVKGHLPAAPLLSSMYGFAVPLLALAFAVWILWEQVNTQKKSCAAQPSEEASLSPHQLLEKSKHGFHVRAKKLSPFSIFLIICAI